ncbi:MAG: beta-ketoacyl-ACP synthase I, partial [bacterium]
NAHGTSTPIGDVRELEAIAQVFGDDAPWIGSTKSLSGHALGAAGVNESIYTLLMMEHGFVAASANIANLDPAAADFPIVTERRDDVDLRVAMSNSFGFGGTNSALIFRRGRD